MKKVVTYIIVIALAATIIIPSVAIFLPTSTPTMPEHNEDVYSPDMFVQDTVQENQANDTDVQEAEIEVIEEEISTEDSL